MNPPATIAPAMNQQAPPPIKREASLPIKRETSPPIKQEVPPPMNQRLPTFGAGGNTGQFQSANAYWNQGNPMANRGKLPLMD